ncbi:MAG: hypothetical protein ABR878_07880 [Roseiarcus sp.]
MIFMDFSSFPSSVGASARRFLDSPEPIQPMMKFSALCTDTARRKTGPCDFSGRIFSRRRFWSAPNGRMQARARTFALIGMQKRTAPEFGADRAISAAHFRLSR